MIQEYPNCTYHGCDIADTRDKSMDVNRYTFSKGNVANKLPYEDNTFDFVHMRFLVLALREDEWPAAIKELIRVTKPEGMIQLVDFELHVAIHKIQGCMHTNYFLWLDDQRSFQLLL